MNAALNYIVMEGGGRVGSKEADNQRKDIYKKKLWTATLITDSTLKATQY